MKIVLSGCSAAGARAGALLLYTFVSFAKAAVRTASQKEHVGLGGGLNRRGNLTARAPRFVYVKVFYFQAFKNPQPPSGQKPSVRASPKCITLRYSL